MASAISTNIASQSPPNDAPPYCDEAYPLIIVGSGLAGHAAAAETLTILQSQSTTRPIVVLEKEGKFGGNSMKATSGINGAETSFQKSQGIEDDVQLFTMDTLSSSFGGKPATSDDEKSGMGDRKTLMTTLTQSSSNAVQWLRDSFGLDLSSITQCGGHSRPRTHRPPAGPAGTMIVKAVHAKLEQKVEFKYNCEVVQLLMDTESKTVIGVQYKDHNDGGKLVYLYGAAVVLASGGFGNDHSATTSLLARYSTQAEDELPTTNGAWATGDGVKMGSAIGAQMVDMSEIQVHPTGFISPKNPDDKTKFLAPEALRGVGGILINNRGQRFVNELDLRANVVQEMREQQQEADADNLPFRLVLSEPMKAEFGANLGFYLKMGLFLEYANVKAFASDVGMNEQTLADTMEQYVRQAQDGLDKFGKQVFPNAASLDVNGKIYVAKVTPVIHYTMGGLAMNGKAQILDQNDEVIAGLYGAGEVTGGLHGKNRLAGNSLLECVVYGRIAARNVVDYCESVKHQKKLHHTEL